MTEDLNDVLLHYGVKGMKWKEYKEKKKEEDLKQLKKDKREAAYNKQTSDASKLKPTVNRKAKALKNKVKKMLKKKRRVVNITTNGKHTYSNGTIISPSVKKERSDARKKKLRERMAKKKRVIRQSATIEYRLNDFLEDTGLYDVYVTEE